MQEQLYQACIKGTQAAPWPGPHQECHGANDFHSLPKIHSSLSLKLNYLILLSHHHQGTVFCGKGVAIPTPSDEAGEVCFQCPPYFILPVLPCPSRLCALVLLFQASQSNRAGALPLSLALRWMDSLLAPTGDRRERVHSALTHHIPYFKSIPGNNTPLPVTSISIC